MTDACATEASLPTRLREPLPAEPHPSKDGWLCIPQIHADAEAELRHEAADEIDRLLRSAVATDVELKRLREIEHHAWHLLDDSAEDENGEISVTKDNYARLVKLLPDEHPDEDSHRVSATATDDAPPEHAGYGDDDELWGESIDAYVNQRLEADAEEMVIGFEFSVDHIYSRSERWRVTSGPTMENPDQPTEVERIPTATDRTQS